MNNTYKEPEFKVVKTAGEDVITTSGYENEDFGTVNNFTEQSESSGYWGMPMLEL